MWFLSYFGMPGVLKVMVVAKNKNTELTPARLPRRMGLRELLSTVPPVAYAAAYGSAVGTRA